MNRGLFALLASFLVALGLRPAAGQEASAPPTLQWWKGNTHTHTLCSDGDSSPGEVAHWYRDHDYDFLVLSDHNYFTSVEELGKQFERELEMDRKRKKAEQRGHRPFLLIPGEEVTDEHKDVPLHLNALGSLRRIGPQGGETKREVVQRCVDAIIAAGGVPSVNHPNYGWALDADELAQIKSLKHFEIFNGHPDVHNWGGGGKPSLEDLWDDLLTRGIRIWGVAVDDAHEFKTWGQRSSNPGRGWIMVRAPELSAAAIRAAFDAGEFYASTGVVFELLERQNDTLRVKIKGDENVKFTTFYIGERGRVLARESAAASSYELKPGEPYARIRVFSSRGEHAWSQPFFR